MTLPVTEIGDFESGLEHGTCSLVIETRGGRYAAA